MKIWRWMFAVIGWLLVVALGVGVLYFVTHPETSLEEMRYWVEVFSSFHPISYWTLGIGLLLLALSTLLSPLGRARNTRLLEFPTESGRVQVDISALESCLAQMIGEEEGVVRARVHLRGGTAGGKSPLGCTATIWFEAGPDVIGRVSEIQTRMRAYYYEVLPIKDEVKIDIRTRLVYQKTRAHAVKTQPRREAPPEPAPAPAPAPTTESKRLENPDYSGPQYPAGGGSSEAEGPEEKA